jgi:hypothetical protein
MLVQGKTFLLLKEDEMNILIIENFKKNRKARTFFML